MPFVSKAQQRYMFAKHPKIAEEFASKTKNIKSLPEYKNKKMKKEHKPGELYEKMKKKNWIVGAIKKPGVLKKELGVKKGEKIPVKKLATAAKKKGVEGKRARLAETLKSFHHKSSKMKVHKKEHSSEAISGLKKFVSEESKEKGKKKMKTMCKKHKKTNCKSCSK